MDVVVSLVDLGFMECIASAFLEGVERMAVGATCLPS